MNSIITDLDVLSVPSEPLTFLSDEGAKTEEGLEIINKIKEVMEANPEILALAAPQIGIKKRIFCLRFSDQIKTFINPIITKKNGLNIVIETCASLPGKEIIIGRPEEITVVYYNDDFKYEDNKLVGASASIFDQQAQILDGVLPAALGMVSDLTEDGKIEEADLAEIIPFYKDTFLPARLKQLNEAITADEDISKAYNQLKFTEGVINGRIQVVESDEEADRRAKAKKAANRAILNANATDKAIQKAEFKNFVNQVSKKSRK